MGITMGLTNSNVVHVSVAPIDGFNSYQDPKGTRRGPRRTPWDTRRTSAGVKSQNVCKSGRAYAATNRVRIFLPCALRRAMYSSNCLTCSLVNFTLHQRALHRSSVA
jgi:hypothetical protein